MTSQDNSLQMERRRRAKPVLCSTKRSRAYRQNRRPTDTAQSGESFVQMQVLCFSFTNYLFEFLRKNRRPKVPLSIFIYIYYIISKTSVFCLNYLNILENFVLIVFFQVFTLGNISEFDAPTHIRNNLSHKSLAMFSHLAVLNREFYPKI